MDRLRIMESFVAVVRSGNFSLASKRLGLPRSVVSKHISLLEEHLGARLFNRTTRTVTPTEVGLEYFEVASRMIGELEERENEIRKSQEDASGLLKVSVPTSFGQIYFPDAVSEFTRCNPHVRVSVVLSDAAPEAQDLYEGNIDVAIRLSEVDSLSVIGRRIGLARWVLCASPAYLRGAAKVNVPTDLKQHDCLVHTRHAPDSIWRFRGNQEFHIKVSGSFSSNNALVLKQATLAGNGICILPEYVCYREITRGHLIQLLEDMTLIPERPIYVLYADRRFLPRRVSLFVDFISRWLSAQEPHSMRFN